MLFIANKPTLLHITTSNQIVITTNNQLILTQLDFIQEFLSIHLTHNHPILLSHSPKTSQTLVSTKSSLQLFWTDWHSRLQLHLLIILNHQIVHSIDYDEIWLAYGNFMQYSPKKIKLCKTDNIDQELLSCFVGSKQFIVSNTKLIMYEHKTHSRRYIQWPESKQYVNKINKKKPNLKAWKIHSQHYLIQASNTIIYLNDKEVLSCIQNEGDLVVNGNIAAWFNFGKMKIYEIHENQIHDLGQSSSFDGHYYGSIIQNLKVFMLFYDFKELMVKTVSLVSQEANSQFQKKIEEKFQLRSQIIAVRPQIRQSNASQQSLVNLIEQIAENKKQSQNNSNSKNSVSKLSLQKALKESISKFQSQFNRSLEQQQKFNDNNANEHETSSNYHHIIREIKDEQQIRGDSQQPNLNEQDHSRNSLSREANSKFEQINAQIVDIQQHSSNTNLQQCVETPAFNFEHNSSDGWGALANAWPSNSKIQAIQEIKQEAEELLQSKKELELIQNYDKSNQSKPLETVFEEELNSSLVVRSPTQSRKSQENAAIPETRLNSNFIQSNFKVYDTLLTESFPQKNQFENILIPQKPSEGRKILNSGIFAKSAVEERSTQQKQLQIEKNVQHQNRRRSFPSNKLTIQSVKNIRDAAVPSSPLLKKYTFTPVSQSQIGDSCKSRFSNLLNEEKHQKKKATQILREIYKKQPQNFQQALQRLISKVITEPQASLFFTQNIRIFNVDLTKDKLLRLYRHVDDNEQTKIMMTKALKQFKLSQVPTICLSFNKNLIGIFRAIYPDVYIQDILEPSIKLYEALMESYFGKTFHNTSVKIQDQQIHLAFPRNLLNILLFLNEDFQLPIEEIFEAYTKKMLKYEQKEIIKKIINSNIPQVCKIDVSIFSKAAQSIAKQILIQNYNSYEKINDIIQMMDYKTQNIFKLTISLIEQFNQSEITFDIQSLLQLPYQNSSFNILKDMIKSNCAQSLARLDLPQCLKKLNWLQKGKKENYYSQEGVQITKMLVTKLLDHQMYDQALKNLRPVAVGLKRSYLAALLINYFEGRFVNRLANTKINNQLDFLKIFKDLLKDPKSKGDPIPESITSRGMKWEEFRSLCKEVLMFDIWELCYIIYNDQQLAYQLTEQAIITQAQLNELYLALGNQSSKYKYIKFLNKKTQFLQIPLGSQTSQESQSDQLRLIAPKQKEHKRKQKFELSFKVIKSSDSIEHSKQKLCRSLLQNDAQTDPVLFDLKFTVSSQQITKVLRQHYEKSTIQQFLEALKVVDKQELGIIAQNVEIFKSVYNLNIDISLKQLIPFEYFFNSEEAWTIVKPFIRKEVNTDNFWIYFLAVEIIYKKTTQVVEFLIDRLIQDGKDEWYQAVQQILNQIKMPKEILQEKINQAQKKELYQLTRILGLSFFKFQ